MAKKSAPVVIPLTLYCPHQTEAGVIFEVMRVSVVDKEVPSYESKCRSCGKTVVFDFNGGLS